MNIYIFFYITEMSISAVSWLILFKPAALGLLYLSLKMDNEIRDINWYLKELDRLKEESNIDLWLELAIEALQGVIPPESTILKWIDECEGQGKSMIGFLGLECFPYSVPIWKKVLEIESDASPDEEYQQMLDRALKSTWFNIGQGAEIFSIYTASRKTGIDELQKCFLKYLGTPHVGIEEIFAEYSTFVSQNFANDYETLMIEANKAFARGQKELRQFEKNEYLLRQVPSVENYAAYIDDELTRKRSFGNSKQLFPEIPKMLYERALAAYPQIPEIWEDYLIYLSDKKTHFVSSDEQLETISRARKACPASPKLTLFYLRLSLDLLRNSGKEVKNESIVELWSQKETILERPEYSPLDSGSSFLNWLQVAKFWIAATLSFQDVEEIENIHSLATEYRDIINFWDEQAENPLTDYSLEHIIIQCFTKLGETAKAAEVWKEASAKSRNKGLAVFWIDYMKWQLEHSSIQDAHEIFILALSAKEIDDPKRVLDVFVSLTVLSEPSLANAFYVEGRIMIKNLNRRKRLAMKQNNENQVGNSGVADPNTASAIVVQSPTTKRAYASLEAAEKPSEPSRKIVKTSTNTSRDREHKSVILSGFPKETSVEEVTRFFADCGKARVTMLDDSALVEFENTESYLSARTKDSKKLGEATVRVSSGESTTVWATNFPPQWNDGTLYQRFGSFGHVISVRLPSLRFNNTRRFAYVQFDNADSAKEAVNVLDGSIETSENTPYQLVVKISDPPQKREKAHTQKNEIIVKGIDFAVEANDLRNMFSAFGEIEDLKIPPSKHGREHDGYAFITYKDSESAERAVKEGDKANLGSRAVSVKLAFDKKPSKDSLRDSRQYRENPNIISINNLSDTVSEAQLRALLEKYGIVERVELHPASQHALVEFANAAAAGKASLALSGMAVAGKVVTIGGKARPKTALPIKPTTMFVPRNVGRK